jgi:dolichol-phosphate mannosyltransferase
VKLSIIMPVFNEQETILAIIARVTALPVEKELIIVDDASIDGTAEILKAYIKSKEKDGTTRILFHSNNKGKAAAIKTGIKMATGDVIAIQDGDLEYDPNDLLPLIELIKNGEADVVYGSRYLKKKEEKNIYYSFKLGVRVLSIASNMLYGQNITDEATCYKVFRADILKRIPLEYNRFEFCPEVTAKVSKMGYKIKELPINYFPRSFEQGKKIGWRDGAKALWVLIKFRFVD